MKNWYSYRSKDRKIRGYVPARDEAEVARLVGYDIKDLIVERVIYNGREFVKCRVKK